MEITLCKLISHFSMHDTKTRFRQIGPAKKKTSDKAVISMRRSNQNKVYLDFHWWRRTL